MGLCVFFSWQFLNRFGAGFVELLVNGPQKIPGHSYCYRSLVNVSTFTVY